MEEQWTERLVNQKYLMKMYSMNYNNFIKASNTIICKLVNSLKTKE